MPKGPQGQKRPADVIGNAVHVMRIATGELPKDEPESPKNPAAVALGKLGGAKGGFARAAGMAQPERVFAATKAAKARWGTKRRKK